VSLMVQVIGYVLCGFLGLFGAIIIIWILLGKIDISGLISEANGEASVSRFQLLIFTFVIASSLVGMVEARLSSIGFPDVPRGVLILLAISAGTFLLSKGISYSQPNVLLGGDGQDDSRPPGWAEVKSTLDPQARRRSWLQGLAPSILILALVGFLGIAASRGELKASVAALLAFLGGLTAWFIVLFLRAVDTDGPPQFETNWGGLGGGLGGWRFSASLIYLICAFVVGSVVLFVFLNQFMVSQKH
jgi:hypothetical protein